MKTKEDLLLIIRSIKNRPVESLLLILGIALGIGATAAGITLVGQSIEDSQKLLNSTPYREIVVSTRESAETMDLPAEEMVSGDEIVLTANDLAAREEIPVIEYAYVMNRTHIRFGARRPPRMGGPPENTGTSQNNNAKESQSEESRKTNSGASEPAENFRPPDDFKMPDTSGLEEPQVDEADGYSVSPEFFQAYGLEANKGSLFTDQDLKSSQPALILGAQLAASLFEDREAYNKKVQVRRDIYTITGVLEKTGDNFDYMAFVPAVIPDGDTSQFARFRSWNTTLKFTVSDISRLTQAKTQILSWFNREFGENTVAVSIPKEEADALADRNNRLVLIILILSIAGLLIATVNVTNILYCRALRKRKTLGILKALGGTTQKIMSLFMFESLFIGFGGAVLGSVAALFLSNIIKNTMGIEGYNVLILAIGVFVSLIISLFITSIPAFQVSRISSSEAIRYE